jgi:Ser/Thr protein kinase RdoA (MazF antagonist)
MVEGRVDQGFLLAAREALGHFPIDAVSIKPVSVSENVTFRVVDSKGVVYSLRLHRPGYNTLCELESERLWSAALGKAGLFLQQALPTQEGGQFVQLDIPGNAESRYAGMTTWLAGNVLSDYLEDRATPGERIQVFQEIGRLAARIHNQSTGWKAPDGFQRPILDTDGLLGEMPRWGRFWEHVELTRDEQSLLLEARARLRSVIRDYAEEPESFGLIHADLHPENIIVTGDSLGLIDFDDCAYGWYLYDLASALIEYCEAEDYAALKHALLEGYRGERPLASRDESMLSLFLLIRGMALIGWFHQRPEHSDSDFFEEIKQLVLTNSATFLASGRIAL